MLSRVFRRSLSQFQVDSLSSEKLEGVRKVMLYRARQRGWLELDVILGSFADKHLPVMSPEEVDLFGEVLAQENPDLFKWLSGQLTPSEEIKQNPIFGKLLAHVNQQHPSL
jgi:succinate dehydrogenase flavin-adding protein (antitoxin of CptAB toxin-antitoxin module)